MHHMQVSLSLVSVLRTLCGLCFQKEEIYSRPRFAKLSDVWVISGVVDFSLRMILLFLEWILTFCSYWTFDRSQMPTCTLRMASRLLGWACMVFPACKDWFLHDSFNLNPFREKNESCLTCSLVSSIEGNYNAFTSLSYLHAFPEITTVTNHPRASTFLRYQCYLSEVLPVSILQSPLPRGQKYTR